MGSFSGQSNEIDFIHRANPKAMDIEQKIAGSALRGETSEANQGSLSVRCELVGGLVKLTSTTRLPTRI